MPGGGLVSGAVGGLLDGMMREIWTGTLALLRAVMGLVGELGSLDITPGGGAISNELWTTMLQLAALIAVTLFFVQLSSAALNPRRHMFQAATGPVQYGVALALCVAVVAGLLGAADGLSAVILQQGANVTDTAAAMDQLGLVDDNNAVKATVLGLLGIIAVVPLAIGYGITLVFRSASILVLVATLPITAAGLTNLATKSWFWRVARWLLALIFLKPAFALCFALGSGIVAAAGRTTGPPSAPPAAPVPPGAPAGALAPADGTGVVTLLLGLGIMFVALFAPYALFRLFAFIEPGTQPHQAMMSAFSSATAGLKSSVAGAANADIGSVLAGATGGRFVGDAGAGGGGGLGGMRPGGSGGSDEETKKQQAAAAGMAVATGGASAAAGAGAAGGAGSGAAGSGADGATRPLAAAAGSGGHGNDGGSRSGDDADRGDESEALAGTGGSALGGGVGGGASGSGRQGGVGGGWSVASWATAAASSVGSAGGGRVGAAAQAIGGAASGVGASAAGIAGATPMAPAPMGGAAGSVGDHGAGDYSGGYLGASMSRAPIPPRAVHRYRDESFDPERHHRDDGDSSQGDEGMAGVIR